jgi:hypothetical protein
MSIFTKTTKGKVMGLMLVLAALGALSGAVTFIIAGNVSSAFAAGGMFGSILTVGVGAAGYLREQEWKARAAARRREYWNNVAA